MVEVVEAESAASESAGFDEAIGKQSTTKQRDCGKKFQTYNNSLLLLTPSLSSGEPLAVSFLLIVFAVN